MKSSLTLVVVATAIGSALFGFLYGTQIVLGHLVVIFVGWLAIAYFLGKSQDEPWLPTLMTLGMLAKLLGSWARLYVLVELYQGSGDAGRYHGWGLNNAAIWRSFQVPDMVTAGGGGDGTRFTSWITGLLYAPFEPSVLGGFWIFSLLAFLGQFFFYLAFRTAAPTAALKRYAILIFFWPTMVYWPSSIGKEALIMFFLGAGSWAAAAMYKNYHFRWLPVMAGAVFMIGMIRIHVAALLAGSIVLGLMLSKRQRGAFVASRRVLLLITGVFALIPLASLVAADFHMDPLDINSSFGVNDLEPAFAHVEDRTNKGGSAIDGGAIRSLTDIPAGIATVLFRPFPHEAGNAQMLAAGLEGMMLLGLILWRSPQMLRNLRMVRATPYLMFCMIYSSFFIWAWSAMSNLGIMARQRSLVLPFVLAIVATLGWRTEAEENTADSVAPQLAAGIRSTV